ncbi:hypothetical protein [Aestuariivivens insulae]|nr:hypothetical protein [Aestuariivivens insulae]
MKAIIKISRHRNQLVHECLLHTRKLLTQYHQDGIWRGCKRYAH